MKHEWYSTFLKFLKAEDKANAVKFALGLLERNEISIEDLYLDITCSITFSSLFNCEADEDICIWKGTPFRTSCYSNNIRIMLQFICLKEE